MRWWTVYFPLCVAACAWPVAVDAMFGDPPSYAAGQWTLWTAAVVVVAVAAALLLRRAGRRPAEDPEPLVIVHPLFWAIVVITWAPTLSEAVVDGTWPWGGPGRAAIGSAGFLAIAVVASAVQVLLARRKRPQEQPAEQAEQPVSPRS